MPTDPSPHPDPTGPAPAPSGARPLDAYGWDDRWAEAFDAAVAALDTTVAAPDPAVAAPDPAVAPEPRDDRLESTRSAIVAGRLVAVDRGEVDVAIDGGASAGQAGGGAPGADAIEVGVVRAGSSLVDDPDPIQGPCTGDWAALRLSSETSAAELVALLPRRSAIVRAAAGRSSHGQVLAANVDTVAVVVSLDDDPTDLGRLERFVAVAWESGAQPVIVLTKADVVDGGASDAETQLAVRVAEVAAIAPGVEVVVTSASAGTGIDDAQGALIGTVALIGPSGAGKSTLANALLGRNLLATGAVRDVDGKGRHTTVRRELVALPAGGTLIDTPGLRSVGLWGAAEGLALVFADIDELAERCRFRDCAHEREPGCAVRAAVAAGEVTERRLESFHKLQRENELEGERADARAEAERKRTEKVSTTALRRQYRDRDRGRR